MEEKKITEQESLELIRKMIAETRTTVQKGNPFNLLFVGYLGLFVSVLVYLAVHFTQNPWYYFLWFLMFLAGFKRFFIRNTEKKAVSYGAKLVGDINKTLGIFMLLATMFSVAEGVVFHRADGRMLFSLYLILLSFANAVTGAVIKEKIFTYTAVLGFVISYFALRAMPTIGFPLYFNLLFGLVYIVMLIIPGHYLNHKYKNNDERA